MPTPQNDQNTTTSELEKMSSEYKQRYGLRDPYTKLVDNKGNQYEALYQIGYEATQAIIPTLMSQLNEMKK